MSERYGKCPRCEGHGFVIVRELDQRTEYPSYVDELGIYQKIECDTCGGTGFNPINPKWAFEKPIRR